MVGGPGKIFEHDIKEQLLFRFPFGQLLANGLVVRGAVFDGMAENRGVRRQPGNRNESVHLARADAVNL